MKKLSIILSMFITAVSYGQFVIPSEHPDSLKMYESDPVPIYSKDYMRQYNRYKRIIVKVYPYALYASDVLYLLEADSEDLSKERKKKKFYKQAYQDLKTDFKFVFMDLYTSEGRMLMKLVHRETGMTVYEIAEKYRGKKSAAVFNAMGKIWDQDVKIKYDPLGEDKIAEHVIQDIESGLVPFDNNVVRVDKEQYKVNKKEHDRRIKENRKRRKQLEKDCKKEKDE
ncbi:MAG: DUF4294 domain-containing protein [Crocinitomicaceae bacterium]|nr:DUF4294 domain-containing protein [Crocinitomicaceae bacterium]